MYKKKKEKKKEKLRKINKYDESEKSEELTCKHVCEQEVYGCWCATRPTDGERG